MTCKYCDCKCKLRKTLPYVALKANAHLYNYYQCPKCRVIFAKPKGE